MTIADHPTADTYMDVFAGLASRWDAVMNDIDAWPDDAVERHPNDPASLAAHLKVLSELVRSATAARDTLARRMAPLVYKMPKDCRQIPNVGVLDVRRAGTRHRYDAELMVGAAANTVRADPETGEVRDVDAAIKAFAKLAGCDTDGYSGWRKTVAEAYGLDLDRYRTTEYGDPKAVLL